MPHDWLLPQCSAAIHHGGAGTTAASLTWACPTTVVYFFGDQPFWGMACHKCVMAPSCCLAVPVTRVVFLDRAGCGWLCTIPSPAHEPGQKVEPVFWTSLREAQPPLTGV